MIPEILALIFLLYILSIFIEKKLLKASFRKATFNNKNIMITGGSSGIGKQLCIAFNSLGATVLIMSRRKKELEKVKSECKYPEKVHILELDLLSDFDTL